MLSWMYKIFDESPSCRAGYEQIISATSSDYPLKFSSYCWIKNVNVTKWAQIIWLKTAEVVKFWKDVPNSKQCGKGKPGQNTSFNYLARSVEDFTILFKLIFVEEIALSLNKFLINFQTDKDTIINSTQSADIYRYSEYK